MRPLSQTVKTSPSHGEDMGSIPVGVTKQNKSELFRKSELVRICFLLLKKSMNVNFMLFLC